MPLQCSITQPSGAVATYHVVRNSTANFIHGGSNNSSVNIDSFLSADAFNAGAAPLGSVNQVDISPLVNNAMFTAPSILYVIEQFLLTLPIFSGATQVS
jgi:hypothetical protein